MRRDFRIPATLLLAVAVAWCAQFAARASPSPVGIDAEALSPLAAIDADGPIVGVQDWSARRVPQLRQAFLDAVYGQTPRILPVVESRRPLGRDGSSHLELVTIQLKLNNGASRLRVALYTPAGPGPFPIIVAPVFCGLDADVDSRLPMPAWRPSRCRTALGRALTRLSHGDAVLAPPVQSMTARGFGVVLFYPSEAAPDDPVLFASAEFNQMSGIETGAVSVWASLYLSIVEVLQSDPRVDAGRIAVWGHSRFGKSALLAAALDERVAAVIANQSGTFGATLSQGTRGETPAQIVRRFPHWFAPRATADQATVRALDQHLLLALIAPRPILLGNAALDRWSDPGASFVAARTASDAYALFGRVGLDQTRMRDLNLDADIAFYLRSGGHGVRSADWSIGLDFLERHLQTSGRV